MLSLNLLSNKGPFEEQRQNAEHLIRVNDVVKAYKTEAGDFLALKNVNLTIGRGEFVGVIGKSGSGKSTLINMITGIDRPTKGEVNVGGVAIHNLNEGDMAKWRGKSLGIVFQFFQLLPILTVIENVMLPMDFCNMYTPSKRRQKALEALDLVGVVQQAGKLPGQLSGGEQQRVAIARALANDPPIILADEPTGNLDSKTASIIFSLFEKLVADGKTIVMVTHDSDLARRVKRTVVIADGEIIEQYLSKTFPSLNQSQLVWVTSQIQSKKFNPGTVIVNKGDRVEHLFIVTRGQVESILTGPDGQTHNVTSIGTHQYFGETALLDGCISPATFQAGRDVEVEVAAVPKDTFKKLISESEPTKQEVAKIAAQRLQEYGRLNGVSKND